MRLLPLASTSTDTLCPYTPPFRSPGREAEPLVGVGAGDLDRPEPVLARPRRPADPVLVADVVADAGLLDDLAHRSEEHTSELKSLMRISFAVFCLKQTTNNSLLLTSYFILFTHTLTIM